MKHLKIFCLLSLSIAILYACNKAEIVKPQADTIKFVVPANFPEAVYKFENNKLTQEGFELGKKLFYDARLSADQSVSCGSCHQQFAAFAQLDHAVSHGVNNCLGKRNAPTLFNLAWQREFFWDGGAKNLEIVPLNAIQDACEMGTDMPTIVSFLNSTTPYPELFNDAFGSALIDSQRILKALAQFTAAMVSANSKYDKMVKKELSFNIEEQKGYQLFKEKCASCHTEPLFTNLSYQSHGLTSSDMGRQAITGLSTDFGKFKVPTLRNIELSSPYMHDGRFKTLDEVMLNYNLSLTTIQKQELISFLKTLTDHEFIKNKNFSEN